MSRRPRRRYVLQRQVGFALRLAFQHHTAIFTSQMVGGLTQPQFAALSTLRALGTCSQNNLGRLTALDSATIKGVVTRLQQRGLLTATPDDADRRRLVLAVTAEGGALLDEAETAAAAITRATLINLTPDERAQLIRLLEKTYAIPVETRSTRRAQRAEKEDLPAKTAGRMDP